MQLLSIAITLVVVVLVSAMILKKYKPHANSFRGRYRFIT